ncbi:RNA-directed DNA polymerase [Nakamurella silvestris]|nr:RNA-directed DNA polymerase [Nakamurella silvestris]
MLAGKWAPKAARKRLGRTLGQQPKWLKRLVREVLTAYPRPPLDRPRELAAFVLRSAALERAHRKSGPLPRPVRRFSTPTSTVLRPFPTPVLDHAGALADLLDLDLDELELLADTALRARRAHDPRIAHYRYHWRMRPGGPRLIEAPKPRLLTVQRRILEEIIGLIPVHPAAHGFVPGRSAVTGAALHVGAGTVVNLDLEHFFAGITAGRVWGVLRAAGFPEPVAHLLTGLTTHATPVAVLSVMPDRPGEARNFRLRRSLGTPHLPQGAPTSPQLANLILYSLDRRLQAYADAAGLRYTRYADDLTFSGPQVRHPDSVVAAVTSMAAAEGFRVNDAKSRVRRHHQRQVVTGIVVNEWTNLARPEYDRLRAVLHDCRVNGPAAANRDGHDDFRAHLQGRVSWAGSLNPGRGAKLAAMFDRIVWD